MTPERREKWVLLSAVPFAATLAFTLVYGVDFPRHDEWNMIPGIGRVFESGISWADLWYPHNEHVAFFPHLVMAGLARASGWNLRVQMLFSVGLVGGILLFLAPILRKAPGLPAWSLPLASCFLFSLHAIDNWLWGSQIQLMLGVFGVVGALCLLGRDAAGWPTLVVAASLGTVASWSFLNGFIVWPIGAFLIALRPYDQGRRKAPILALWIAAAIVAVGVPLMCFDRPAGMPLGGPPGLLFEFVSRYLGAGLLGAETDAAFLRVAGWIGQAALLAGSAWIVFRRRSPATIALVSIGLFGLASGYMIALGRLSAAGIDNAGTSRYTTFSGLSWIVIVLLPGLLALRRRWMASAVAMIAVVLLIATQSPHFEDARERRDERLEAAAAMRKGEGISFPILGAAFGGPLVLGPILGDRLATLRRFKLSFFRHASADELNPPPFLGPLQGQVRITEMNGRTAGVVEAQGGVPGNMAYAILLCEKEPLYEGPMAFDHSGRARFVFDAANGSIPEGTTFHVFSLDRTGTIVRSPPATVQR